MVGPRRSSLITEKRKVGNLILPLRWWTPPVTTSVPVAGGGTALLVAFETDRIGRFLTRIDISDHAPKKLVTGFLCSIFCWPLGCRRVNEKFTQRFDIRTRVTTYLR